MHLVAIGGSDAGRSAALRARELDPTADLTVVVADAYPTSAQPCLSMAHGGRTGAVALIDGGLRCSPAALVVAVIGSARDR
jgi:NADPH-dependent 2,4-dienoyl-CoA reductase/sulfur reductase-like enzyme